MYLESILLQLIYFSMNEDHQVEIKQRRQQNKLELRQHDISAQIIASIKNEPNLDQKYDTNFLNNQIQAMLKRSSQTKLIEEFLPFDCNIMQSFDEQQLCTEPTLKYAIVPHNYLRFEDKYFGGEAEQSMIKDIIVRVQQHLKQMSNGNKEQAYYMQRFKRIKRSKLIKEIQNEQKDSMMYGYKMYKITKVRKQQGYELQIQKQLAQIPLQDIIEQPLLLDCVQVSQIIIKQIECDQKYEQNANNKPKYEIVLIINSINQRRDSSIYSVKYTPSPKDQMVDAMCGNLDGLVTLIYCLDLQINTFYGQFKEQLTYQSFYYLQQGQQLVPSFSTNRLINQLWQKQTNTNNFRFYYLFKYKGQSIQHASFHMKLEQKDIYNLFKILSHFHKIQNIGLTDTTYKCIASKQIPNKNIIIFTNLASATSFPSKEQKAYDIVTLITKILDANYEGRYAIKLQDITETANEDEILFKFQGLLNEMHKLLL